ncbi:hypothetical protein AA0229_1998 [Gluconobacter cerinus NRIC 0229]|nr:hypothetical protein AA0229_1998 [Gluconobacter cerinus NRIC 0229]
MQKRVLSKQDALELLGCRVGGKVLFSIFPKQKSRAHLKKGCSQNKIVRSLFEGTVFKPLFHADQKLFDQFSQRKRPKIYRTTTDRLQERLQRALPGTNFQKQSLRHRKAGVWQR